MCLLISLDSGFVYVLIRTLHIVSPFNDLSSCDIQSMTNSLAIKDKRGRWCCLFAASPSSFPFSLTYWLKCENSQQYCTCCHDCCNNIYTDFDICPPTYCRRVPARANSKLTSWLTDVLLLPFQRLQSLSSLPSQDILTWIACLLPLLFREASARPSNCQPAAPLKRPTGNWQLPNGAANETVTVFPASTRLLAPVSLVPSRTTSPGPASSCHTAFLLSSYWAFVVTPCPWLMANRRTPFAIGMMLNYSAA